MGGLACVWLNAAEGALHRKAAQQGFGAPQSPAQDWFSDHAWNAAIGAAEEQHWQAASVLFGSSAQYQAARANPTAAQLQKQKVW